jgi:hypothetical protein
MAGTGQHTEVDETLKEILTLLKKSNEGWIKPVIIALTSSIMLMGIVGFNAFKDIPYKNKRNIKVLVEDLNKNFGIIDENCSHIEKKLGDSSFYLNDTYILKIAEE